MKRPIVLLTISLMAFLLTSSARADDVEDVKAAYARHIMLSRTGQAGPFVDQHLPGHSAFGPTGGMLTRYDSPEEEKKSRSQLRQPEYTSLASVLRHLEVKVYGGAAVVTGYLQGPITLTDGSRRQGTRRVTAVWIKQGSQWREVHDHMSPLIMALPAE
ncbi:MAG: nuclear transport factor 2 family protein [Acidobacteriota bacterium]